MKFNIVEVFCEILSGLILILLIIPIIELSGIADLKSIWCFLTTNLSAPNVTLLIVFSYLLGLIVDSIGFSVGDWFLDKKINDDDISPAQQVSFYNNVTPQVLSYRDTQWAYYSLYRNLFILFILHAIIWSICLIIHHEWYQSIVILIVIGILEIALFRTLRGLSKLYIDITSSIRNPDAT